MFSRLSFFRRINKPFTKRFCSVVGGQEAVPTPETGGFSLIKIIMGGLTVSGVTVYAHDYYMMYESRDPKRYQNIWFKTAGKYEKCFSDNHHSVQYIPKEYITKDIATEIAHRYPELIEKNLPKKFRTEEIYIGAIRGHHGSSLWNTSHNSYWTIPENKITDAIAHQLIESYPQLFNKLPNKFMKPEWVNILIKKNPNNMQHAPSDLLSFDTIKYAVNQNINLLKFVPEKFREDILKSLPPNRINMSNISALDGYIMDGVTFNKLLVNVGFFHIDTGKNELSYAYNKSNNFSVNDESTGFYLYADAQKQGKLWNCTKLSCGLRKITIPNRSDALVVFKSEGNRIYIRTNILDADYKVPFE